MATITRQDRHLPNLSRGQSTLEATDYVILEGGSSISYADLITVLSAAGIGGGSSGTGEVIDGGDRMTGGEIINLGTRV